MQELNLDDTVGAENREYLQGKAGKANFKICSSKDNGFSLVTDMGYVSVNRNGQIDCCKTVDNEGKKRMLSIYA